MKLITDLEKIKQEIYTNGPLMLAFTMYSDFNSYSTGIYEPTTTTSVGGHAVKVIGWNYDSNNRLYWICQNQFGTAWGNSGYFNIYAQVAGIDTVAFGCTPAI